MKTIALLDHYSKGHHLAFIKIFAKYLLKAGYRVCVFYPDCEREIREYIIHEKEDVSMLMFQVFKLKKREIRFLGRFKYTVETLMFWMDTKRILTRAEKDLKLRFSIVFFSWLDDYLGNNLAHRAIEFIFPFRWSGLYFHPNYLHDKTTAAVATFSSIDSVLRAKTCISVCIHDELLVGKLSQRIGKRVVLFPEFADTAKPDIDYFLSKEILLRANGRTVVGLIGLEKRKGVFHFMDIVRSANPEEFFFFLGGEPLFSSYDEMEVNEISIFLNQGKENFLFFSGYIEEGPKINSVVSACDILFLVYFEFKSSSNFMTKAVYFKKLVLATDQFWIGNMTSKYNIGLCVEEGNTKQGVLSLLRLRAAAKNASWDYSLYDKYMEVHTENLIDKGFENALRL